MTVRIGWDEYEVALLIDACNRIRDNKIDKAECVHKLSNLLRQRAKAKGINIDEVFRNENGIALQMTKMEYLLTDGKKGLPGASKLYIEMAKMSKLNSDEFEKILILAKEQIGYKEAMNNMNTREKFIQWLSSNPISKYSSNTIVNALDEGSEYCCSRSLSKVSFWDMNNKNEFITVASKSSPNLCVNSSFSYVVLSTLLLSSRDLTEWSLVYHNTLSYQRFYDLHSIHYDHLEGLHQSVV